MALSLALTAHSSVVVGRFHGGRDHTTVLYARDVVGQRRRADPELAARMARLERRLAGGPTIARPEPVQLAFLSGPLFDPAGVPA